MSTVAPHLHWYFESTEKVPKFFCVYVTVTGTQVVVRSGLKGTRGTIERTLRCANERAGRLRAPDEVTKYLGALGAGAKRYRRVLEPETLDFDSLPEALPARRKAATKIERKATPSVEKLRELLARPEHAPLARFLTKQRFLRDIVEDETEVEIQRAPMRRVKVWHPASDAGVVVFDEPCHVSGNVFAGVDGRDRATLIFLGGLAAKNLFVASDTDVYCSGPLVVEDLLFAATPDSSLVSFTSLSARVVYAGHGDAWPTAAAGTVSVEVIDDYIEGKGVRARRPKARAAEMVKPSLLDEDGRLERETVRAGFFASTKLLR